MSRKLKDWSGWWDGMRSKVVQSGAKSLATSLSAFISSNAVEGMHIPGLSGVGMGWKAALTTMLVQFGLHSVYAGADYASNKPDPAIIEVDSNPEAFRKSETPNVTPPTNP